MAIETQAQKIADERIRPAAANDIDSLAKLMDESYRGTIDHEGETLEQCADEMRGTLSGKYGSYISEASFIAIVDGEVASACLVTRWKDKPLVAFTMTGPRFQRQGLSRALIEKSVDALAKMGESVLYLVVTDGNTAAKNLYRKIGFKDLGRAYGKQPPPKFEDCLETDRLFLEPICEAHAAELCELFSDRELHHFVPFEPPTLEEQQKRCARWAIGHSPDGSEIYLNWAAREKQSRKVVGHFQGGIKK
jgi:RimJ/RimL family protein N-acetyltransferase